MLVGEMDGATMQFFRGGTSIVNEASHSAKRLETIRCSDFAPLEVVLRESIHTVDTIDEQNFYDDLVSLV